MPKILLLLLLGFIVAAGLYLGFSKQPQKYSGPVEKVIVGDISAYKILNLVAKEKGYFKDQGLDVEIKEYESGPPEFIDLIAGKIDIATAAEFVGVRHMSTNQDLKILSQIATHEVFEVIGRKSKGIKTPGDLKGKKIGVTRKSAGEFYLGRFLTLNNIQLGDVTIVDLLPKDMVNQLENANGFIDAAVFQPRPFNLEQKLGTDSISWPAQGGQKTFGLIYSTDGFIKAHPGIIERYLRSLTEAEQYYKEHTKETKDLVAKAMHYDDSYIQYIWSKFDFSVRLDQGLLLAIEDEARWVIDNKLEGQTKVPNYLDFIYFDALEKVKPEAITIIR